MMTVSIEVGPVCFETEIRGEYHPEVYRDMLRLASDHVYSLQARLSDAVSVPEGSDSLSEQDGLEDVYRLDADEDPASP